MLANELFSPQIINSYSFARYEVYKAIKITNCASEFIYTQF